MFNMSLKQQQRVIIVTFLAIPLCLLITFSYFPAVELFFLSTAEWEGFLTPGEFLVGLPEQASFVGLDNYIQLVHEPESLEPILVSLYYFVGAVVQLALSLWFAVLVNSKLIGRNLFKTFLFLPFVLNAVAASMVFQIFYQVGGGLDSFLSILGFDPLFTVIKDGKEVVEYPQWLANPSIVNWALVAASVWRYLGFNLILFYGVLQSIPQDQYEAARIEGASEWQQFRFITLPSIKMIIGLQALLAFVGSLSVFDIPYIITKGANGTRTFVMETIRVAFEHSEYGPASAMAVFLLVLVVFFMIIQKILFKEEK
ncbi:MAG: carbohydrate ABC transporter permease [Succinivibrio sp.]